MFTYLMFTNPWILKTESEKIGICVFTCGLACFLRLRKKYSRHGNLPTSSPSLKECHENNLKEEMSLATQKKKKSYKMYCYRVKLR